jgi:predicted metalloprotease with PDZ domain
MPILEKTSSLIFNTDFYCGYSPERIVPGDKINTLTTIKKVTSGSTPAIADFVDTLYKSIITAGTFKAASIKVAEASKAKNKLGWVPKYDLGYLVKDMMRSDINLMKKDQYLKDGGYSTLNYFE